MARLKESHESFLVHVLDLTAIGYPSAQKVHEHRADVVEQHAAGFAVAILHPLHQTRARPASLFSHAVDLFHYKAER
jgi:hypothetical protein